MAELILIVKKDARIQNTTTGLASPSVDVSSVQHILDNQGAGVELLFGLSESRLIAQQQDAVNVPYLANYYRVSAPPEKLEQIATQLNAEDLVDAAYVKPQGSPPILQEPSLSVGDAPPSTPIFAQGYLNAAPGGVDANIAAILRGGSGSGIRVIDCEWGWRFTHEDLLTNQGGVVAGTSSSDTNHGTAVIGVISGDKNGFGITGIAPDAVISASSFHDQSTSTAIKAAADKLGAGDVILLEIHRRGPNSPSPPSGQLGYIAVEWWPDDFAAIQYAVSKEIVVIEAAGNGYQNMDDPIYDIAQAGFPSNWTNPFNLKNPSSGAVIVGAGAPPPGTNGRDNGPDRSRLDFSNYGARVDAQGWGREVASTGYGDAQGGLNADMWYTSVFNGTSSASPIVTGSIVSLQGILKARGRRPLTSAEARAVLRSAGSPQTSSNTSNNTQRIGKRPNIRTMIPAAAKLSCKSADYNGDGKKEIFVTSPGGIGILQQSGSQLSTLSVGPNGSRFGEWLINTADNFFGPAANFDGNNRFGLLVLSPWGMGILEPHIKSASVAQPNGSRLGSWLLDTPDNCFGPAADFDGDGRDELLVTSPWGMGILKKEGNTVSSPVMAHNGTRIGEWLLNTADNEFGPVGDFNGDGKKEILVVSPWGIGIMQQRGSEMETLATVKNGTRIGEWLLNTSDNRFGPVGDFDGDGRTELLVTSPWGIGILKLQDDGLTVLVAKPNGSRLGDWLLNTSDNEFGPARDLDGDGRAEILITSPWGVGLLKLDGSAVVSPVMHPNGTRLGEWLLDTSTDSISSASDFDGDGKAEVLITSPWGVGILKQIGNTLVTSVIHPNGRRLGEWMLDTDSNDFGNGT